MALWGGRAVVARGWGGIDPRDLPDTIFSIEKAPHDRLFRYVSAVVHHGGAGTTSAGLHLGRPTFVVPQAMDQPYWGRRVYELGCGPKPIRLRKLTAETLAQSLADLSSNESYRRNAAELAEKLRSEDGVDRAIKVIERVMANFRAARRQGRAQEDQGQEALAQESSLGRPQRPPASATPGPAATACS
jgi:sterol 3beta-glucosyltransferase